jgi:hypothetical protein
VTIGVWCLEGRKGRQSRKNANVTGVKTYIPVLKCMIQ